MSPVVHELIEDALRELASKDYQRDLWLATEGPEVSSLVEARSRLWDDSGLGAALEDDQGVYNTRIDHKLRELKAFLARIDDSRGPMDILDDPLMARARTMASELLRDLRNFGYDRA